MITPAQQPDLPEWLRDLYPFRTRMAEIGQFRMSFVDEGPADGPALLLLHGNPTWSFLYREVIKQVSQKFRVIAPDQIGFGLSDKPEDPEYHTLVRHIENLSSLLDELHLGKIAVVAHGAGGPIGLGYAVAHPESIERLILCNTWSLPVSGVASVKMPLGLRISNAGKIGAFLDSLLSLSMASSIKSRMFHTPSDWVVEGYKYPFPGMGSRAGIRAFSRMFFDPANAANTTLRWIHENLKKISAPAELLYGAQDRILTHLPAYLLRDALGNPREPVFVEETAHFLPEDAPGVLSETILREPPPAEDGKRDKTESLFRILS